MVASALVAPGMASGLSFLGHVSPAGENPALVYLDALHSPVSRRGQRSALQKVADIIAEESGELPIPFETFPWAALRYAHVAMLRAVLERRYKPSSLNKMLCAVRGTLKAAYNLEQISGDDYRRAIGVPGVRAPRLPTGRKLTRSELSRLFDACSRATVIGRRDAAMLSLLYGGGLRRAETSASELAGLQLNGELGASVRVVGKGDKERLVPLTVGGVSDLIQRWLETRGDNPGTIITGSRELELCRRFSVEGIGRRLKRLAVTADVAPFQPHDLRRTFISDALELGIDVAQVAAIVGHSDIRTTGLYDVRPDKARARAAAKMSLPL